MNDINTYINTFLFYNISFKKLLTFIFLGNDNTNYIILNLTIFLFKLLFVAFTKCVTLLGVYFGMIAWNNTAVNS